MARHKDPVKTVTLTAPGGTKVTVAESSADKYKARGYKGVPGRPKADKPAEK